MAAESGENNDFCPYKPNDRTPENGWVVVRSQKRPGMLYDFNVRTGEAYWHDDFGPSSEKVMVQHQNQMEFQEPIEPPTHVPATSQKRKAVSPIAYQHSKQSKTESAMNSLHTGNHKAQDMNMSSKKQPCCCEHGTCHNIGNNNIAPNIYNKQIINNQLTGKYTIPPPIQFMNSNNSQCHTSPTNNFGPSVAPGYPWTVPPPPLGEPMYLPNVNPQNTIVPLSNKIHEAPIRKPNGQLSFQANNIERHPQIFVKNNRSKTDLRGLLNRRNGQVLQNDVHERQELNKPKTDDNIDKPKAEPVIITESELNPDDMDPWLETFTDVGRKKLRIDMEYIWDLAADSASRDCWYVVPTQSVLINNIRFLTVVTNSDKRARLLVPQDAVRALRSVTFSNNTRVADYAKRAMILIRQTSKYSNSLEAPDMKSCLKLIEQGKHVVLLVDEKDTKAQEMKAVAPVLTVNELKDSLTLRWEEKNPAIIRKIKITFPNNINKLESLTEVMTTPSLSPSPGKAIEYDNPKASEYENPKSSEYDTPKSSEYDTPKSSEYVTLKSSEYVTPKSSEIEIPKSSENYTSKSSGSDTLKSIENDTPKTHDQSSNPFENKNIQIIIPTTPKKMTANASVQTDLILVCPAEESAKETISHVADAESSNDNTTIKVPPRKIRLKRQNQPSNVCDTPEQKHFKWRKRKDNGSTSNTPSQQENGSITSSLSNSTPDLLAQQNDNAVDYGVGKVHIDVDQKIVDETSTSGVISNSLDSDSAFRISKESYMNESILDQIEEVAYEITSDFMKEHLSTRIDEWVALFNQIMEEVLSQILRVNPPFEDSNMPGPWTVMEATLCVERKFSNHRIIAASCKKFSNFIESKSDQKGSIKAKDISPEDFMKMYNCGVQLINVLQMNLQQNEDLKLASTRLSQLLNDIQENNSEETSLLLDTFETDVNSPNLSDNVSTNISSADVADNSQSVPASQDSSHQKCKSAVCDNFARHGLRSSRPQIEMVVENKTESEVRNAKHTLFFSLGLKHNTIPLTSLVRTISNDHLDQNPLTAPIEKTQNEPDTIQNDVKVQVVRNFTICPELEKKIKDASIPTDQYHSESEGDNYNSEDDVPANDGDTDDFTEDVDIKEHDSVINIHKFFVRITSDIQLCMVNSQRFCEDTYENVKNVDKWRPEYKMEVEEKIDKVSKTLLTVCDRLKDILARNPSLTECKFSGILKAFKVPESNLKELKQHLDTYRIKIEIYLEHSYFLLQFVKLLGEAVKKK